MGNSDKLNENGVSKLPLLSMFNEKMRAFLFWFYLYTFLVWAQMMAHFFTNGGVKMIVSLNDIYVGLLTVYLGQKESIRWFLGKNYRRIWGEIWVYVWLATGLLLYFLAIVFPGTFKCLSDLELGKILGFVFTYFAASEISKSIYQAKRGNKEEKSEGAA